MNAFEGLDQKIKIGIANQILKNMTSGVVENMYWNIQIEEVKADYLNSKGEKVIISEMPNPHLVNSYLKYYKQVQEGFNLSMDQMKELKSIVKALRREIKERGLLAEVYKTS